MIVRGIFLSVMLALAASAHVRSQVPLSVDPTFRVDLPAQNVFSAWPLPDGKVIISGNLEFEEQPVPPRAGERLLVNGDRDFTFNQGFLPMGGKIVPWQDRFYAQNDQIVRRFLMDGSLDPDFIMMNADPYFSSMQGGDYHVFPDGRVLMTGFHSIDAPQLGFDGVYNLVWFFNDGHLDTTRVHRTGDGTNWRIKEIPAGTSGGLGGKFLVDTYGTEYEGQPVDKVFRIHADGSLDMTFHSHIEWGYVWAIEPLLDGRCYLGGTFRLEGGTDTLQVIRVMPDGSLDPTFNNSIAMEKGAEFVDYVDAGVTCIYPIAPGLVVLTGLFSEVDGQLNNGICMIDTTGSVINSYFNGDGCGSYTYFSSVYGEIDGITQAPNGDYYIWGAYHGYTDGTTNDPLQRMITRLHGGEIGLGLAPDPVPQEATHVYPNPSSGSITLQLEQLPRDGYVLVRDALGREVNRQRVRDHYTTITFGQSGVYVIELWDSQRRVSTQRVVVQ